MFTKAQVKQLIRDKKSIERLLDMARQSKVIFSGVVTIASITQVKHASTNIDVVKEGQTLQDAFALEMVMKRFENELICIIKGDGVNLPKGEKYIGTSKCHKDDEFDLGVGCTLAQARATAKVQMRRLELTEQILGGTVNE
ncbi:hypothetical protein UT300009_30450 [Paraclostridium bifermentans]